MFSDLIKELREKAGLTQSKAAEVFDVPVRTYGSWERNERQPDFGTLIKIADYYDVTTDYLLGRTPIPVAIKKEAPPAQPPEGMKRVQLKMDLGDDDTVSVALERKIVEIVKNELAKQLDK